MVTTKYKKFKYIIKTNSSINILTYIYIYISSGITPSTLQINGVTRFHELIEELDLSWLDPQQKIKYYNLIEFKSINYFFIIVDPVFRLNAFPTR